MIDWIFSHWIEIFGALTGLIYIVLEIKENIWMWHVGIATSALYVIVFFQSKFYADMALNGYYLGISVYGWYWWKYGNSNSSSPTLPITKVKTSLTLKLSLITVLLFGILYFVLEKYTDSPVAMWDAIIAALSITATWMLAKKILEQWIVWIFANGLATIIYANKNLYPTAILFFVYFILSIVGYYKWKKDFKTQTEN
jgi:nicotinamide mononucleotide transporter